MALDARDLEIAIDSHVRYLDTGTVGKVIDLRTEDDVDWVKMDKTGLWYKAKLVEILDDKDIKQKSGDDSGDINIEDIKEKVMNFEDIELSSDAGNGGG